MGAADRAATRMTCASTDLRSTRRRISAMAGLRRVGVVERAAALGRGSKLLGHDCNGLRRLLRRATRPGVASTAGAAARAAAPKTAARAASASAVGERRGAGGGGHFEWCTAASSFLTELRQIGRPRE